MPAFDETTSRRRRGGGSNKDAVVVGGAAADGLSGGDVRQQQQRRNTDHRATSFQQQSQQCSHRASSRQRDQHSNVIPDISYTIRGRGLPPCRMAFVPGAPSSDLYGVINRPVRPSGELGPTLLEIRRLAYKATNHHHRPASSSFSSSYIHEDNNHGHHRQETVLVVSRGTLGLGNNVSSTCLDFCPAHTAADADATAAPAATKNDDTVRCATGLSDGTLCIHTFTNLFTNSSSDNDSATAKKKTTTTTLEYYIPQQHPQQRRQQLQQQQRSSSTSVAWRAGNGVNGGGGGIGGTNNLVAIGLVGSSSRGGGGNGVGELFTTTATTTSQHQQQQEQQQEQQPLILMPSKQQQQQQLMQQQQASTSLLLSQFVTPSSVSRSPGSSIMKNMSTTTTTTTTRGGGIASSAAVGAGATAAVGGGGGRKGDCDFGVLIWDIETQSSIVSSSNSGGGGGGGGSGGIPNHTPAYRYGHNFDVESLSWLNDGQLLAAGGRHRGIIQLYDLRVTNKNNVPPISLRAHTEMVSGIVPENSNNNIFATFGRNASEPVKIWDVRMNQSPVSEITLPPSNRGNGSGGIGGGGSVNALTWLISRPGILSIAYEDSIRNYDTRSSGSRAVPVGVSYLSSGNGRRRVDDDNDGDIGNDSPVVVQCLLSQPQSFTYSRSNNTSNPFEYYPHRILAITSHGQVHVIPESQIAPLAVSKRDGRVASALGGNVSIGNTTRGPTAMESNYEIYSEDISSKMMRRARCLHTTKYSTDAMDNLITLREEKERVLAERKHLLLERDAETLQSSSSSSMTKFAECISQIDQLLNCWRWIMDTEINEGMVPCPPSDDITALLAKGRIGVMKLLRLNNHDYHDDDMDRKTMSDTLFCDIYDSPLRRAALNICGWMKKYGTLQSLLDECESRGEFERSATLAIWHGDLKSCVMALQRGAEDVKALSGEGGYSTADSETLNLIAMCVAGFNVMAGSSDGVMRTTKLWSDACNNLLQRPDMKSKKDSDLSSGVSYLRGILLFLQNIGGNAGFNKTIYDEDLSLADRMAFACRFLPRAELHLFLDTSMRQCIEIGNLEGLLITGLDKRGILILQSYVDRFADVQTAALISCRVVLPIEWTNERRMCSEWLENYRLFLNGLQMWNSRAAFDVGRFEHMRQLNGGSIPPASGRHSSSTNVLKKQSQKHTNSQSNIPPQLWARCNYCSASLPLCKLRRQEGIANSWLSRQKPVLTCCPQCKKPLPRCSICLLTLNCLNPYMELQRERGVGRGGAVDGGSIEGMEDLSGLASIPFATWFSWCMRCKHGGHAHHMVAWFEKHSTCAVSGCDCNCQLDGTTKLSRPGYTTSTMKTMEIRDKGGEAVKVL